LSVGHLRPVLHRCPGGWIRYRRDRLHRAVAHRRMGRGATSAWPGIERSAVRAGLRSALLRPARRPLRSQDHALGVGAAVRRRVPELGGAVPLVLAVVMFAYLPESVRYMVAEGYPTERIRNALNRISSGAAQATSFFITEKAPFNQAQSAIGVVLSRSYVVGSV